MAWTEESRRFLKHLRAEGRTLGHAANVRGILRRFGESVGGRGFEKVKKDDVETWLAGLHGEGLSPSTVGGYLTILKAAFRYLNDGETPPCLKGLKVKASDSRVRTKGELLTKKEYRQLLGVMPPAKALIFRLLWDTGARPGEVLRLRREDLSFDHAQGLEYVDLSFPGTKNGEPRTVPLVERDTLTALKAHLSTTPENGSLFPSPRAVGGTLRPQALWSYLERAAKRAGLKKRVYPYLFRHTAATRRYNAPAGVRDRMMGWKSNMAKNYEHLATEDVRDYLLEHEAGGGKMDLEEARELLDRLVLQVASDPELAGKLRETLAG